MDLETLQDETGRIVVAKRITGGKDPLPYVALSLNSGKHFHQLVVADHIPGQVLLEHLQEDVRRMLEWRNRRWSLDGTFLAPSEFDMSTAEVDGIPYQQLAFVLKLEKVLYAMVSTQTRMGYWSVQAYEGKTSSTKFRRFGTPSLVMQREGGQQDPLYLDNGPDDVIRVDYHTGRPLATKAYSGDFVMKRDNSTSRACAMEVLDPYLFSWKFLGDGEVDLLLEMG